MSHSQTLLDFFRHEFQTEQESGFAWLSRVPDTSVMAKLAYYRSLSQADKLAFADCCAHWAYACYGFVVGAPKLDHAQHPFFPQWSRSTIISRRGDVQKSGPQLRAEVQKYKIDAKLGGESHVTREEFEYASAIRSVKAPELRKRVRAALKPLGYYRIDELGYYC